MAEPQSLTYVCTRADDGERLDRVLARAWPSLSRSRIKSLIESGCLGGNGAAVAAAATRVKAGQSWTLRLPEAVDAAPRAQAIPLVVAYEDRDLIVIDKPAGLVVHPAPGHREHTLVNALIAHCGASLSGIGGVRRPGIVHRLDKDTSGLMLVAKSDAAHRALAADIARRSVVRAYTALVWGVPAPARGDISGNIGRSPSNRKKMAVVPAGGKPARTHYRVRRAFGGAASRLECRLETGRTHQIRVHLRHLGYPVIGDPLYGLRRGPPQAMTAAVREAGLRRQALHAHFIRFDHPSTGEAIRLVSQLANDLRRLITHLESL